ncbi:MAG TPA: putative glycolipid-binding domain-containing protein [Candidatus Acidoferrales bacterium]|jgi:hypothetical protein|nr:putative glycolipid-binding domain-containing protein [Candidatus Acidoferrales bacterium]
MKSTGLERFEFLRGEQEWILHGTIIMMAEGIPIEARYEAVCDDSWRTKRADISLRDNSGERSLKIVVVDGRWFANGRCHESITSCADIDLEWSPSTNTLPIRRLNLAVGEKSGPIIAAWVRFPSLQLQPLSQQYERISKSRYQYVSNGGAFVAGLEVDEEGLVTDYEGLWQREAAKLE